MQTQIRNKNITNEGDFDYELNMVIPFKIVSSSQTMTSPQARAFSERSKLKSASTHDVTHDEDGFPKFAFVKE